MTNEEKQLAIDDPAAAGDPDPTGEQVARYLRRNPDFLVHHPDAVESITQMAAPARPTGDGVVDLQRVMLDRLRDEMESLRGCAQDVIETSRSNMSNQSRTHAAVLALVAVTDFEHMVRTISNDLPLLLDVDVVTIGFEPAPSPRQELAAPDIRQFEEGTVDRVVGAEQNVALIREMSDDGTLFGSGAGLVRSAALARLNPGAGTPVGLLALGSRTDTFEPGQGCELIWFLARVLECGIHNFVDAPA